MPFGYLIPVVIIAFATAVSIAGPRPRQSRPSFWGYWVTFEINEQPFAAFLVLAVISLFAFAEGDLASPAGLGGLALAALAALGLAVLARRALTTGDALRAALAGIDIPRNPRPWAHILFAPLSVRRRDVTRVSSISYGDAGRQNLLDVYHRRDRPAGGPVVVYFHGGGFRMGSKNRESRALLYHLAAQGCVCVTANYRLAPRFHYPDAHIDAKKVVVWARAHASSYGGDPRTIVACGTSAGGHLAAMLALTPNDPEFQPAFEREDTSIAAAVGFSGYYGRVAGESSSPMDRLGQSPPFLLVHGDLDSLSLVEDAREFAAALRERSANPVLLAELPGGQHAFDLFFSLRYSYVVEAVAAWIRALPAAEPPPAR